MGTVHDSGGVFAMVAVDHDTLRFIYGSCVSHARVERLLANLIASSLLRPVRRATNGIHVRKRRPTR
jgi:hypothetical protein